MHDFRAGPFNVQSPVFFSHEGIPVPLVGLYRGCAGFLVSNGPSLNTFDLAKLGSAGAVSIGINNGPKVFRPNLYTCGDQPCRFIKSIWLDPQIMKIVPMSSFNAELWDNEKWELLKDGHGGIVRVRDCPNVVGIHRNDLFTHETWLHEDSFGWGNSGDNGGCRTVFLLALKIMYAIGVRKLFIVGADMHMEEGESKGYAFEQVRCKGAAKMNNKAYAKINKRCEMLKPFFDKAGFQVYNCTPKSGLVAFPYMPFEDAVRLATARMPDLKSERSADMYLELHHPGKLGLAQDAVEKLNPKEKEKYKRREQEWVDRLKMYHAEGKEHLIPERLRPLLK